MTTKNTVIIRQSHADVALESAPTIDQSIIDQFATVADKVEAPYVKPSLETYLLERHNLSVENYDTDAAWIIATLDEYVRVMKRGASPTMDQQSVSVGKLNLVYLRALRSVDVLIMFDIVLWYFSFYEDEVFRAEYPYRGISVYKFGTPEQQAFFQHITAIAQLVCDIKTRNKRLREHDFVGSVRNVPAGFEKQRAGLTTFINYYTNF